MHAIGHRGSATSECTRSSRRQAVPAAGSASATAAKARAKAKAKAKAEAEAEAEERL
jgi:hypothetical protein